MSIFFLCFPWPACFPRRIEFNLKCDNILKLESTGHCGNLIVASLGSQFGLVSMSDDLIMMMIMIMMMMMMMMMIMMMMMMMQ